MVFEKGHLLTHFYTDASFLVNVHLGLYLEISDGIQYVLLTIT